MELIEPTKNISQGILFMMYFAEIRAVLNVR